MRPFRFGAVKSKSEPPFRVRRVGLGSVGFQGMRGFTRAGSAEQHVVIEDEKTRKIVTVPAREIEPLPNE